MVVRQSTSESSSHDLPTIPSLFPPLPMVRLDLAGYWKNQLGVEVTSASPQVVKDTKEIFLRLPRESEQCMAGGPISQLEQASRQLLMAVNRIQFNLPALEEGMKAKAEQLDFVAKLSSSEAEGLRLKEQDDKERADHEQRAKDLVTCLLEHDTRT
ncbi:hypothetical protein M5689_025473 [Euphorbia peplus]|nr:hypothetical protein M5689_025472 [Euphorbia peplus]WCJ44823.1 hypothetical protein M5689_025473 [Euphorbia peplus]